MQAGAQRPIAKSEEPAGLRRVVVSTDAGLCPEPQRPQRLSAVAAFAAPKV